MSVRGRMAKTTYWFHNRTLLISGYVEGDVVRSVQCIDADTYALVDLPDEAMPEVIADLQEAARLKSEGWKEEVRRGALA